MPTILGANTLSSGYDVANSLRFDGASSSYFDRAASGSTSSNTTFTVSFWAKRAHLGDKQVVFMHENATSHAHKFEINFRTDNKITIETYKDGYEYNVLSAEKFTDISAWYHFVFRVDTTQGTEANRYRIYANGAQLTLAEAGNGYPTQNFEFNLGTKILAVGRYQAASPSAYLDGYLAEVVYCDGQSLDPTSFGEFDSDTPTVWKPKDVSGLTFGNNGFYLDFEDSSNLGNDVSSNASDFTANNLAAVDQSTDTCTNNYAVLNELIYESSSNTFSEGNLKVTGTGSDSWTTHYGVSTFAVSQGKWYVESKVTTVQDSQAILGIFSTSQPINSSLKDVGRATVEKAGRITVFGSNAQTGLTAFSNGDIAAIAFDATNGTAQFYRNGSAYGSAVSSIPSDLYYFATTTYDSGGVVEFNFGSPPFSISSGNSDQNGYGNFEYSVPSGYYALNTKNLAEFG